MLASLGACSRASYQFTAPTAYLPAPVVAPTPPVVALAEPLRLARTAAVPRRLPRASSPALPPAKRKLLPTSWQLLLPKKPRLAQRALARTTASNGAYFSGADFGSLIALLLLYTLLITALIAGGIVLLVKLIRYLMQGKSRRAGQPLAAPPTAP